MKTETKKRLLGGYFKNSAYHEYYNEMYGGVQSKVQTGGPNRDENNYELLNEIDDNFYDGDITELIDEIKIINNKLDEPNNFKINTDLIKYRISLPDYIMCFKNKDKDCIIGMLNKIKSVLQESEQTYDEDPPPLENIPISELQPAQIEDITSTSSDEEQQS